MIATAEDIEPISIAFDVEPTGAWQIMVQGDKRLRRPYLVIVAARDMLDARYQAARQLAEFLRSPETQAWLKGFGKGTYDDQPLFFPVTVRSSTK